MRRKGDKSERQDAAVKVDAVRILSPFSPRVEIIFNLERGDGAELRIGQIPLGNPAIPQRTAPGAHWTVSAKNPNPVLFQGFRPQFPRGQRKCRPQLRFSQAGKRLRLSSRSYWLFQPGEPVSKFPGSSVFVCVRNVQLELRARELGRTRSRHKDEKNWHVLRRHKHFFVHPSIFIAASLFLEIAHSRNVLLLSAGIHNRDRK